jgi:CRISPR-associated protein Cmr3
MTEKTTTWIMEPCDPLLVRDGRPFGPDPGARAMSLPFPFPSTIAGGVRTRAGTDQHGVFTKTDEEALQRLKEISIRGPVLVQLDSDSADSFKQWLFTAPRDALFLSSPAKDGGEDQPRLTQLVPLALPLEAQVDLEQDLWLVGDPGNEDQQKPLQPVPKYWFWEHMQVWLLDPTRLREQIATQELMLPQLGLRDLTRESRTHVSIAADKQTAKDGMLFETSGLEFTLLNEQGERLRLAIAVSVEDGVDANDMQEGLASFGGERRLLAWHKSDTNLPTCPVEVKQAIVATKHCRVILLTPACFAQGYHPNWLQDRAKDMGIHIQVKAIATDRPLTVSGWDLVRRSPKQSLRLAPAGTVLFLSLEGDARLIEQWIDDEIWMHCISDDSQGRRDGFGLAVLGTWSGKQAPMEKETAQ